MNDNDPRVSVIITAHAEKPEWLRRAIRSVTTQIDAPDFEIIVVADRPSDDVWRELNNANEIAFERADFGDLGESRNRGVQLARGKYVACLDADDLFGSRWLRQAYDHARELENARAKRAAETGPSGEVMDESFRQTFAESFVLHPEYNVFFGAESRMHLHIGDDHPEFDARDLVSFNAWSALAFAARSVFERFPYKRAGNGCGFEDFQFNVETVGAGVAHRVVPGSVHLIRKKNDPSSMAHRFVRERLTTPAAPLYDRRDLPTVAAPQDQSNTHLPDVAIEQVRFAHRDVGERQVMLSPQMTIRKYPRQRIWNDQAWLRDQIGDKKHVVLVDNLHRGGAEKYAIDFARAVGAVIVETTPAVSAVWREKAAAADVRVVTWQHQTPNLSEAEQAGALQRALIQCKLSSLLVCNSRIGWMLVHENAEALATRVLAATFARIPVGGGFEVCPPFFLKHLAPNFALLTDNEAHAAAMREYNGANVIVLPPKCDYAGPSKRKQIKTDKLRVLWAGRGSAEKNPGVLPAIAAIMEDKADFHVWGDVKPLNGPENLKYRGPFDGFDKIDGTYDVYLMTSITEGCPNTAMEAVMADIPVVGPEIGALPDLVTMHYRGDPTAIAQAIAHAPAKYTAGPKLTVQKWRDDFDGNARAIVGAGQ